MQLCIIKDFSVFILETVANFTCSYMSHTSLAYWSYKQNSLTIFLKENVPKTSEVLYVCMSDALWILCAFLYQATGDLLIVCWKKCRKYSTPKFSYLPNYCILIPICFQFNSAKFYRFNYLSYQPITQWLQFTLQIASIPIWLNAFFIF